MKNIVNINVKSEIGKLNGVIIHTPGEEVENMTPENAERALYSDIINLSIAREEYKQVYGVLSKITNTYEVKDLLYNIVKDDNNKLELLNRIEKIEPYISDISPNGSIKEHLMDMNPETLSRLLIEGVELERDNLTKFLSDDWYSLRPMHNFFFTRDASMSWNNNVVIGKMASSVRDRESVIMKSIFDFTSDFRTKTMLLPDNPIMDKKVSIEGGDFLVAREDILLIGSGCRTSTNAIDGLIDECIAMNMPTTQHIIVQQLPHTPESFIHLDMVFTLLDKNCCMVFEPLIMGNNSYKTIHIEIKRGKLVSIREENNIVDALKQLGMDLNPILCGGTDEWNQEREQWHSGANFFCLAPGKVMGYSRNNYTIEEMNKAGFEIIKANDIISGVQDINNYSKCVVTLDGSELPRGGGGARCMTMPVNRDDIIW